jgi:hypothetical protein
MPVALVIAVAILAVAVVSARAAVIYPWCTSGAGMDFGAVNCGFTTFEQCLQTARGNGQTCQPNPLYQGPSQARTKSQGRGRVPATGRGD